MKSTAECSGSLDQMDEPNLYKLGDSTERYESSCQRSDGGILQMNGQQFGRQEGSAVFSENIVNAHTAASLLVSATTNNQHSLSQSRHIYNLLPSFEHSAFSVAPRASGVRRSFTKGAAFIKSARPDTHSLTDGVLVFAGTVGPRGDVEYDIQFCKTKDNCYQNRIRCYSLYHVLQFTLDEHINLSNSFKNMVNENKTRFDMLGKNRKLKSISESTVRKCENKPKDYESVPQETFK
uniref:Uncharacterized protein n=1 Tax=Glossina pallidipes TaxID=7398 RepID=A0A1B0A418_GLOPL